MGQLPFSIGWDDFRLVKAIADGRGLPAAAARLGINHSTAFRRLGQIEKAVGARLFERHRSGYALTAAGEEMVEVASRLGEEIDAFERRLAGRANSPAGEVRVTTNDSLLVHLLIPLFARFRRQCPDVRLDIVLGNQALNLSRRDADVAVRATDSPPEILVGRRAARIAWALYGRSEDFPEPAAPPFEALGEHPWVSLGDNLATLAAVRFVKRHVAPERVAFRVDSVFGLAEAVEAGLGIGHLPCFIADTRPGLRRLAPPEPDFAADLWLLTHPDLRQSARVRVLLDFLAAELSRSRPLIEGGLPLAATT
jgi:DNA-binding transcriptional LysR family regulator